MISYISHDAAAGSPSLPTHDITPRSNLSKQATCQAHVLELMS